MKCFVGKDPVRRFAEMQNSKQERRLWTRKMRNYPLGVFSSDSS
jgi:hypothetical protein